MVGRLFDHPMMLIVLLVLILLLFGAPKLPGMARSLGQSMRIFKTEVDEMKSDGKKDGKDTVVDGEVVDNTAARADQNTGAQPSGSTRENGSTGTGHQA